MDSGIITMETSITQGNFPFQKGRSYRVHPGRAANLIAGGDATAGAPDGATIFDTPAEEGAIYRAAPEPFTEPAEIPATVVTPEKAEEPAKTEQATATEIGGAEALTGSPKHKKGKLSGSAVPAGPKKA
jgi:hypothetical protein